MPNKALEPTGVNGLVSPLTSLVAGGSAFVRWVTMHRVLKYFTAVFMIGCCTSCSPRGTSASAVSLDLSVSNATATAYWVDSETPAVSVGILSPGISKTMMDIAPPKIDAVTLELSVDTNRSHRSTIKVDISALRSLSPGSHDAIISIVSETQAKLLIDGHEK